MPLDPNFTWVSSGLENVPPDGFPTPYPLANRKFFGGNMRVRSGLVKGAKQEREREREGEGENEERKRKREIEIEKRERVRE
jgi:hypothetical protein